ncbi:hypothetical protein BDY24DRAFT_397809 [Mrakia frigida]|uniref:uncharacterized protein n=1 Tax=Mrakia frigida TaxID=29902 RepID=UPI003FCBF4AD
MSGLSSSSPASSLSSKQKRDMNKIISPELVNEVAALAARLEEEAASNDLEYDAVLDESLLYAEHLDLPTQNLPPSSTLYRLRASPPSSSALQPPGFVLETDPRILHLRLRNEDLFPSSQRKDLRRTADFYRQCQAGQGRAQLLSLVSPDGSMEVNQIYDNRLSITSTVQSYVVDEKGMEADLLRDGIPFVLIGSSSCTTKRVGHGYIRSILRKEVLASKDKCLVFVHTPIKGEQKTSFKIVHLPRLDVLSPTLLAVELSLSETWGYIRQSDANRAMATLQASSLPPLVKLVSVELASKWRKPSGPPVPFQSVDSKLQTSILSSLSQVTAQCVVRRTKDGQNDLLRSKVVVETPSYISSLRVKPFIDVVLSRSAKLGDSFSREYIVHSIVYLEETSDLEQSRKMMSLGEEVKIVEFQLGDGDVECASYAVLGACGAGNISKDSNCRPLLTASGAAAYEITTVLIASFILLLNPDSTPLSLQPLSSLESTFSNLPSPRPSINHLTDAVTPLRFSSESTDDSSSTAGFKPIDSYKFPRPKEELSLEQLKEIFLPLVALLEEKGGLGFLAFEWCFMEVFRVLKETKDEAADLLGEREWRVLVGWLQEEHSSSMEEWRKELGGEEERESVLAAMSVGVGLDLEREVKGAKGIGKGVPGYASKRRRGE